VNQVVLADTGPLVALFDRGDEHHDWAKRSLGKIRGPLLTSEPVVSEVLFLLGDMPRSRAAFLDFWSEGALKVSFDAGRERAALIALLEKYQDTGMSLADATMVRMSELHAGSVVWTLDEDFRVYRRMGRKVIPLLDWPR